MAMQLSVLTRNNILEAIELSYNGQTLSAGSGAGGSITGTAAPPRLQFRTGAQPASCAAAATGTLLAEMTCPADWMQAAASGAKALNGTWQTTGAAGGNAGHYRIVSNDGTTCHEQGSITVTGGGGDMTVDNVSIGVNQAVTVTSKSFIAPHA